MARRATWILILAATVSALAFAGCASGTGSATGDASATASRPTTPPVPTVKPPAQPEMLAAITKIAAEKRHMKVAGVSSMSAKQDSTGVWWAAGVAVPVQTEKYDELPVVIVMKSGVWTLFELGDDIDPANLPAEVRSIL